MRAKLHIRAGKRRLRQGKIGPGIVTLYDALTYAIQWYLSDTEHRKGLVINNGENIANDNHAFAILSRAGILDKELDYGSLDSLIDRAMENQMPGYDYSWFLRAVENTMTKLGVMPFDEAELPPEDPSTF